MSKTQHPITDELLDQLLANYQNPEDLIGADGILKQLTKKLVERALDAELTHHLGHDKHQPVSNPTGNTRNGFSKKKLKGEFGELPIEVPRDPPTLPDQLLQPAFDLLGTVLLFPSLQHLVVASLGLDNLASFRVFVAFQRALTAWAFHRRLSNFSGLWIEHGNHVTQGVAVVSQEIAQLGFKLDFFLQFPVAFESFQALLLLGDLGLQGFVFGDD